MKEYFKRKYKNIILLLIAIILLAIGSVFFKNSFFGSDAVSTLNAGLAKALKLNYGTTNILMNIIALILLFIVCKKYIGIGTFLVTIFLGLTINLIDKLHIIPSLENFDKVWYIEYSVKFIYLIAANLICSFAVACYIYSNSGLTGFEGILMKIHEVTKIPFGIIKIVNDVIFIIIGWLLGGVVGIGTIISSFVFGPLVDLFRKLLKKTNIIKDSKNEND